MGFDIRNANAAQVAVADAFGSPFIEVKHEIPFSSFVQESPVKKVSLAYEETSSANRDACRLYIEGDTYDNNFSKVTRQFASNNNLELASGRGKSDIRFSGIKPNQALDTVNKLLDVLHAEKLIKSPNSTDVANDKEIVKIKDMFVAHLDNALEKRDNAYNQKSVESGKAVLLATDAAPRFGRPLPNAHI